MNLLLEVRTLHRPIYFVHLVALLLASFEIYVHLSYRMSRRSLIFALAILSHHIIFRI